MNVMLLIILMAAVTYIPRALPAFIVEKVRLGKKTEKFLKLIPYTAMAALVFPGILSAVGGEYAMYFGLIGGAVAAVLAYFKCPVILSVVASVVSVYVLGLIFI